MSLQAGSLVHIYTDSTVLVTHGGVEMGQGLHTKVSQSINQSITPFPADSDDQMSDSNCQSAPSATSTHSQRHLKRHSQDHAANRTVIMVETPNKCGHLYLMDCRWGH